MKFKLVEEFDSMLHERDNTNLRRFLLSLLVLANFHNEFDNPVVHHTTKDRSRNNIDELVVMEDTNHRSMHNKYRNKPWDINAHKEYKYIEVQDLIEKALFELKKKSHAEEKILENENTKTK